MRTDLQQITESPVAVYQEGLRFFTDEGILNETLRRVTGDLENHRIDYLLIGAVAFNNYGYRRFTEGINLILTRAELEKFRAELVGRDYRPAFEGATKKFRTTAENVAVEIITSNEYPGDGKPKPIGFSQPGADDREIDGIKTVSLEKLIELKLASGMTAPIEGFSRRSGTD